MNPAANIPFTDEYHEEDPNLKLNEVSQKIIEKQTGEPFSVESYAKMSEGLFVVEKQQVETPIEVSRETTEEPKE